MRRPYDGSVDLGKIGVWTSQRAIGEENAAEAARFVEECGYGTFWLGGSPRLPSVRPLLEATEKIVVGTSIVNLWANEPEQLASEYAALAADFADRLVVGIGIGHPEATSHYAKPLTAMRAFLDGVDAADPPLPRGHRCLAALAPKMLALSAERALGAIPYFVPVAHTSAARQQLGTGPLLAPEVAFVLDEDPERGRERARDYARLYLGLSNYTNNLLRHGFTEQDVAGDGIGPADRRRRPARHRRGDRRCRACASGRRRGPCRIAGSRRARPSEKGMAGARNRPRGLEA